jgi:TatD DNase family protein
VVIYRWAGAREVWHFAYLWCVRAKAQSVGVPLERMMVETDCPYISPEPVRNKKPCEPAFVVHTAKKLAELKGTDFADFAAEVTATSRNFFGLA